MSEISNWEGGSSLFHALYWNFSFFSIKTPPLIFYFFFSLTCPGRMLIPVSQHELVITFLCLPIFTPTYFSDLILTKSSRGQKSGQWRLKSESSARGLVTGDWLDFIFCLENCSNGTFVLIRSAQKYLLF